MGITPTNQISRRYKGAVKPHCSAEGGQGGLRTSTQDVMDGLLPASSTVASIRGATGKACTMTLAARWGTSSGFLSKAMRSALVGSCAAQEAHLCLQVGVSGHVLPQVHRHCTRQNSYRSLVQSCSSCRQQGIGRCSGACVASWIGSLGP